MKKTLLIILILKISMVFSQSNSGIGVSYNYNKCDFRKAETTNNLCATQYKDFQSPSLFYRLDLSEKVGFQLEYYCLQTQFLSTVLTYYGLKTVNWSSYDHILPIGIYLKKPSVVGKPYAKMAMNVILFPKYDESFNTGDSYGNELHFQTKQHNNWGFGFNLSGGIGYTISNHFRIELEPVIVLKFNGQKEITNSYDITNEKGKDETIIEEVRRKNASNFNVDAYITFSLVFMLQRKAKVEESVK